MPRHGVPAFLSAVVSSAGMILVTGALLGQSPAPTPGGATRPRPVGACQGGPSFEDGSCHALGLVDLDPRLRPDVGIIDASECRFAREDLPSSVDNSAYLPPIGDQGNQGSCVCWAVSYNCKTHAEAREHGWDPSEPAHQFSPAFSYNQVRGRPCEGTNFWDVFELMRVLGNSTMVTMPYNQHDCTSWPPEAAYREAINYRTGAGYAVDMTVPSNLAVIKAHIAQGNVGLTGVRVYHNLDYVQDYDYNYCLSQVSGTNRGGHGVTIVGYDDDRPTADGVGAFRCVNSWGGGFGDHGFFWISYQATQDKNRLISDGWYSYFDEVVGDHAETAARIELSDARFADLAVTLGRGMPTWPLAHVDPFDWTTLHDVRGTNITAPTSAVWVDLAALGSVPQGTLAFLQAKNLDPANGVSGKIDSFSIVRMADGERIPASQTPVAIPSNGTPAVVSVAWSWPALLTCSSSSDAATGFGPLTVRFQSSASGGTAPYDYAWDFGDGTTDTAQNPSHTYGQSGSFSARVTVGDDASGSVSADPLVITVKPSPGVASMQKAGGPFRILVAGSNLQNGINAYIGDDAAPWPSVTWISTSSIEIGGGGHLKKKVPKSTPTTFRFVNPDGGETATTWQWP